MKKTFNYFVIIFLTFFVAFSNVLALENDDIFSNEALLINMGTEEVLYAKDTNTSQVPIASLTKIMTYIITIENIEDIENTFIEVPTGTKSNNINQGASRAGLEDGYSYSVKDLLYGLMVPSGCDAADTLAYYIGEGDYDKFVTKMNEKAAELGMNNTIFYNASGLEDENMNTNMSDENDLYKLAKYAYDLPYFKEIIQTEFYVLKGYKDDLVVESTVRNTNYMVGEYNGAEYYYQYSLGGKTGNLGVSGRCLISFAKKGDLELIAITLGVPYEHSNYHLTDHKTLFDYGIETYSENITIDIGPEYRSVNIGEQIKILPSVSNETIVSWASSDESVATVDEFGVVTGKKLGRVKIVGTTSTGNQDYTFVSVGFYNGIDIKYSSGPSDPNGILGYGKIDWSLIKEKGIDFAVIRAGYALNNKPDSDPYFVENIKGATANDIDILISFDGYATTTEHAIEEAEYLLSYLNDNIYDYLANIKLPIVYNLYNAKTSDPQILFNVANAFKQVMNENGYDVILKLGRTKLLTFDLNNLINNNLDAYVIWRATIPDFSTRMAIVNDNSLDSVLWEYRTDGYLGDAGVNKKITMSAMYMDYQKIDTGHQKFEYPDKNTVRLEKEYIYDGTEITADVIGFDSNTMNISGNIQIASGTHVIKITPKEKWSDGTTEAIELDFIIKKAIPSYIVPNDLKGLVGDELKKVSLPDGWSWKNEDALLNINVSEYSAIYAVNDLNNYELVEINLQVQVDKKIELLQENYIEYKKSTNKDLVIKLKNIVFEKIYINDKLLEESNYKFEENTLTINKSYLAKLDIDTHEIKIESSEGYILIGTIDVKKEKTISTNVQQNDNNVNDNNISNEEVIEEEVKDEIIETNNTPENTEKSILSIPVIIGIAIILGVALVIIVLKNKKINQNNN